MPESTTTAPMSMVCTPEGNLDTSYTQRQGLARIGSVARTSLSDSETAWRETASAAQDVARLIRERLDSLLGPEGWSGRGADAFRSMLDDDLLAHLDAYAESAEAMAENLKPITSSADSAAETASSNDVPWDVDVAWSVERVDPERSFWGHVDEFFTGDDDAYEEAKENAPYNVLNGGRSVVREVEKNAWEQIRAQSQAAAMPAEYAATGTPVSSEVNQFDHAMESLGLNNAQRSAVQAAASDTDAQLAAFKPAEIKEFSFRGGRYAAETPTGVAPDVAPSSVAPSASGGSPTGTSPIPASAGNGFGDEPGTALPGAGGPSTDLPGTNGPGLNSPGMNGPGMNDTGPQVSGPEMDAPGALGPDATVPGGMPPGVSNPDPSISPGTSISPGNDTLPGVDLDHDGPRDPQKIGVPPTTVEAGVPTAPTGPMPGTISPNGPLVGTPHPITGPGAGAPTLTPGVPGLTPLSSGGAMPHGGTGTTPQPHAMGGHPASVQGAQGSSFGESGAGTRVGGPGFGNTAHGNSGPGSGLGNAAGRGHLPGGSGSSTGPGTAAIKGPLVGGSGTGFGGSGAGASPVAGRGTSFTTGPLGRGIVNPGMVGPMAGPGGAPGAGGAGGAGAGAPMAPMGARGGGRNTEEKSQTRVNNWLEEDQETWEAAARD